MGLVVQWQIQWGFGSEGDDWGSVKPLCFPINFHRYLGPVGRWSKMDLLHFFFYSANLEQHLTCWIVFSNIIIFKHFLNVLKLVIWPQVLFKNKKRKKMQEISFGLSVTLLITSICDKIFFWHGLSEKTDGIDQIRSLNPSLCTCGPLDISILQYGIIKNNGERRCCCWCYG